MTDHLREEIIGTLRAAGCVFAEDEADILLATSVEPDRLSAMVVQRAAGRPLEHVVGWADFCGVRVSLADGVFVPRPRSALLVMAAARIAERVAARRAPVVVDLCCGSGAVAAAVAARVPGITLHAADVDPAAVRCARTNLAGSAMVYEGDLFAALPEALRGRIDVLVANVPYVPTGDLVLMPAEARLHEPRVALDGGADGLEVFRRVAADAPDWLARHGAVLMETSRGQCPAALEVLARYGLRASAEHCPELAATAVTGHRLA